MHFPTFNQMRQQLGSNVIFIVCSALAVLVPIVFLLWFLIQTIENEEAADRQEQQAQMVQAVRSSLQNIDRQLEMVALGNLPLLKEHRYLERNTFLNKAALSENIDGLITYDSIGSQTWPVIANYNIPDYSEESPLFTVQDWLFEYSEEDGPDDLEQKLGIEILKRFEGKRWQDLRNSTGRAIYPAFLYTVILNIDSKHAQRSKLILTLEKYLLDQMQLPSSQMIFLTDQLSEITGKNNLKNRDFTLFSIKTSASLKNKPTSGILTAVGIRPSYAITTDNGQFTCLFKEKTIVRFLENACSQSSTDRIYTIQVLPPTADRETLYSGSTLNYSSSAGARLPGWDIYATLPKEKKAALFSKRMLYMSSVLAALAAVMVLVWIAAKNYREQRKETQLRNDFLSTVSHELRTPLTSTRMLVDTLAAGHFEDPERTKKYLSIISRENARLSHLVETFLTYTRMERGKIKFEFQTCTPEQIIQQASQAVSDRFSTAGVDFQVTTASDLPQIQADPETLVSAVINLLDNAYKYTGSDKNIHLLAEKKDQHVLFSVKDNGEGLSSRDKRRVMERFYRADSELAKSSGGSGLGLSIVKFIADGHGGALTIDSEIGSGSNFTIKIPVTEQPS